MIFLGGKRPLGTCQSRGTPKVVSFAASLLSEKGIPHSLWRACLLIQRCLYITPANMMLQPSPKKGHTSCLKKTHLCEGSAQSEPLLVGFQGPSFFFWRGGGEKIVKGEFKEFYFYYFFLHQQHNKQKTQSRTTSKQNK